MNEETMNPNGRFSKRADYYALNRPTYPPEILDFLNEKIRLKGKTVADIGSGTGIFTELLLKNGNPVYAIEPNEEMRRSSLLQLEKYEEIRIMDGTAEDTSLPDRSVEVITAAQAFHWFHKERTLKEFRRILKENGHVVLLWNELKRDARGFRTEYQSLYDRHSVEHKNAIHSLSELGIEKLIPGMVPTSVRFDNIQTLPYENFIGRILSSSFSPDSSSENYDRFLEEARIMYEKYSDGETIRITYDTHLFYYQLN